MSEEGQEDYSSVGEWEISDDDDDSLPSSLQEEDPPMTVATVLDIQTRLKLVSKDFPREPESRLARMWFWFHMAVQYAAFSITIGSDYKTHLDNADSDADFRNKALGLHLFKYYQNFVDLSETMGLEYYAKIVEAAQRVVPPEKKESHFIFDLLKCVGEHKEMHSRGIKGDANKKRTRMEIEEETGPPYNIVTGEIFDSNNPAHSTWRQLAFHPLPSDDHYQNIDPVEGDEAHQVCVAIDEIQGNNVIEKPFQVYVTPEWDKLLRHLHTVMWMEEYLHTYVVGGLSPEEMDEMKTKATWEEAWQVACGEYATKPIEKFSRVKKVTPQIVSRAAEFRDLLKDVTALLA